MFIPLLRFAIFNTQLILMQFKEILQHSFSYPTDEIVENFRVSGWLSELSLFHRKKPLKNFQLINTMSPYFDKKKLFLYPRMSFMSIPQKV
jgi:hypothetical protein